MNQEVSQMWLDVAKRKVKWMKAPEISFEGQFKRPVQIHWFSDGVLNLTETCIDSPAEAHPQKVAFIFEPESAAQPSVAITFKELQKRVNQLANGLRSLGVKKGDRVTIYLPMIPEAVYSMLACARIGAIHSVVFGGFSPESLAGRIEDCSSKVIITANTGVRAGKLIPLKANVDEAIKKMKMDSARVEKVIVVKRSDDLCEWNPSIDISYDDLTRNQSENCPAEKMKSTDPLFILYTSGSTGKPKGVLHSTGGYLTYAAYTHEKVFGITSNDIFWCTADVGWITGHSYVVYGPLANRTTSVIFEGVPSYPNFSRFWNVIDKHQVSVFYTAPTAIRALMKEGEAPIRGTSRKSLRLLGTVGEPINPEAWNWYHQVVGDRRCEIVDTWWQTETGGIMISPIAGQTKTKPGSATLPLPGIELRLVTLEGEVITGKGEGILLIEQSWPGQMMTVYKDHSRFEETYFSNYPGYYFTGDGCRRDDDSYYWITGRVDDVINVSGHRIGTAEVESALVAHQAVAEAAVVGFPHDIKGQGIYAYVTLKNGIDYTTELQKDLINWVRQQIGPIATPDRIHWAPGLPKTRSGKIMRRILRKIAENQIDQLGDISTLADPSVVESLIKTRD